MFLRNCWYVAGWSRDYTQALKPQKLLGDDIVLYRKSDGSPVALEDACPHRKLPLSMGAIENDHVVCGYHGLTFDCTGTCIDSPTQRGMTPRRAVVRSYPVVDRYRLLWIWMGDPALADPDKIFEIENFDDPTWGATDGGILPIACNYLWVVDNLLDPSHVAWVHVTSFGGAGTQSQPLDMEKIDRGVIVSRWIYDQLPSPYYKNLVRFEGTCDRKQHYEMCFPAIALNKSVYTPAGTGGPGKPAVDQTYINISYNFLTPVDEENTQYIWFQHRNTDPDNAAISNKMNDWAIMAFNEDKVILEAVQKGMADMKTPNIDLGLDLGAKTFRKQLQRLIDAEQV
ncbi:aromatic ring-hydroxylating dioxygenase subunit alpha [Yoonia sediminilitoris]|uniref:Vanillate O-demethylase monooxygenase subunit n=1 Tax=Yoonia sediminilitoris TaxID=1286148 RepID=A0A2T6KIW4_9RHOB|nr:aromatic ring-hydroxylating dioxygenase subunit alpha [Yoonia sediminilitoris]PUB15659.1 vanillate O-demethylase monooxygenase subunit [Yoonia sediminilitoris]RCW96268.1 vanillate O-demethylase monooxygenase subunit [Yoonia sediminilitoris]